VCVCFLLYKGGINGFPFRPHISLHVNPQNTTIYAFPFSNPLIHKGKTPKKYYMSYTTIIPKM